MSERTKTILLLLWTLFLFALYIVFIYVLAQHNALPTWPISAKIYSEVPT